ncbi:MAG: MFS transporter, partial [Pseudomonadota bacterium]
MDRLSVGRLGGYAYFGLPLAMLTLPVYIYVPTVYSAEFGLPLAAIGAVLLVVRLFDAVSDPLIGWLSDRVPIAGTRRKAYIALAIPLMVVSAWMLMRPGDGASLSGLALWSALLSLGWTLAIIPYNAWGAELSGDYFERNRVTGARESLVVVGTVFATAMPALLPLFGQSGDAAVLASLAVVLAILLPLCGGVTLLTVPEPLNRSHARVQLRAGLAHMRRNAPFMRLILAFILNGFANGLPASLFLFFAGSVLVA